MFLEAVLGVFFGAALKVCFMLVLVVALGMVLGCVFEAVLGYFFGAVWRVGFASLLVRFSTCFWTRFWACFCCGVEFVFCWMIACFLCGFGASFV